MSVWAQMAMMMSLLGGSPDGVVLDFTASWCVPCQSMQPAVHRLQSQGYPIRTVDIDQEPALAQRYGIEGVPTFVLIVKGQERQRRVGPMSEEQLRHMARQIPVKEREPARGTPVVLAGNAGSGGATRGLGGSMSKTGGSSASPKAAPEIRANLSAGEAAQGEKREGMSGGSDQPFDPIRVCARIRVKGEKEQDTGSGTVIFSEPGRTLILTCGHLFRNFGKEGTMEVDLFHREQPQRFAGRLLRYDLDADVGLISIATTQTVPSVSVAALSLTPGQLLFSAGCGGGEPPTRLQHLVTSTTKYSGKFIECTAQPQHGRSGGGLFLPSSELVGVCVFADPGSRRGLYAGLPSVHRLLRESGFAMLIQNADSNSSNENETLAANDAANSSGPLFQQAKETSSIDSQTPMVNDMTGGPGPEDLWQPENAGFASVSSVNEIDQTAEALEKSAQSLELVAAGSETVSDDSSFDNQTSAGAPQFPASFTATTPSTKPGQRTLATADAALPNALMARPDSESLRRALSEAEGAEVVCIIRPKNQSNAASRVVIIHEATNGFLQDLTGQLQNQIHPTSMRTRNDSVTRPANSTRNAAPAVSSEQPQTTSRTNSAASSTAAPQRYQRTRKTP